MKEVKIVLCQEIGYDDGYSDTIVRAGITDWEPIEDEDFKLLKSNLYRITSNVCGYDFHARLLVKDEEPVAFRIESIKKALEAEKVRQEAAKKEKEKKAKERLLKKAAKDEAKKKELYEALKEEFEK